MKKETLRAAAKLALARKFQDVRVGKAQGVIPGARLQYIDSGANQQAAVRTSNDREVGLLRDRHGEWRTLSKVQLVLVAVPAKSDDELIEVLAFDPSQLKRVFDDVVKRTEKGRRSPTRFKAPIFLPLDAVKGKREQGLRALSEWTETIAEADVPEAAVTESDSLSAVEAIRDGIAKGLGVDASRVELTFSFKLLP
jgi:hypothetical protein